MTTFPYKLHDLLKDVEENEELSTIISWLPDGKSFRLHSPLMFEKKLLKEYFPKQTQLKSFMRQLQYYGFLNFGDGLFSHEKFQRGQRALCGQISHMLPTKTQKSQGRSATRPLRTRGRKKKCGASTTNTSESVPSSASGTPPSPSRPLDKQLAEEASGAGAFLSNDLPSPFQNQDSMLPARHHSIAHAASSQQQQRLANSIASPQDQDIRMPARHYSNQHAASLQHQQQQQQRLAVISQQQLLASQFNDELFLGSLIHNHTRNSSHLFGVQQPPMTSSMNTLQGTFLPHLYYGSNYFLPSNNLLQNQSVQPMRLPTSAVSRLQTPQDAKTDSPERKRKAKHDSPSRVKSKKK